jgi:hypothetical protein
VNSEERPAKDIYEYRPERWRSTGRAVGVVATIGLGLTGMVYGIVQEDVVTVIYGATLCLIVGFLVVRLRTVVRGVRFISGLQVEFRRPAGSVVLQASDLLSLRAPPRGLGVAVLRHRGGSLRVVTRINGWHEVITRLKRLNPSIDVRGI